MNENSVRLPEVEKILHYVENFILGQNAIPLISALALGKVWIDFKFLRLQVAVSRLKIAAMPLWRLCILLAT